MAGIFEISKSESGKFHFALKASNGQVILTSEHYESKAAAEKGIASVQTNSPIADRYEKKVSSDGRPFFNLKAGNHEVIGTSQLYSSVASRDEGIASVQSHGSTTVIQEKN